MKLERCEDCNCMTLWNAIVKKTNEKIIICEECDALWVIDKHGKPRRAGDFEEYGEKYNIQPSWDELILLDRIS